MAPNKTNEHDLKYYRFFFSPAKLIEFVISVSAAVVSLVRDLGKLKSNFIKTSSDIQERQPISQI